MRIRNLNPGTDVGASAWWVTLDHHALLLDAGTHPKRDGRASLPLYARVGDQEPDAIAISHCHLDHVGSLPVAMQRFPRAHVLMTELSYFLVERVLHNSVNVMGRRRDELGISEYPLFTHAEVEDLAARFEGFRYGREVEWAAHHKLRAGQGGVSLEFLDAGHTLGSAGVQVRGRRERLLYTGDVSFRDQTLLRGARFEPGHGGVLLMETTRGAQPTPAGFSRQGEEERFLAALERVQKRKGSVLIPAFALGRTQEVLGLLALAMQDGRVRRQPVYIGGLGRVFTEIYDLEAQRTHRHYPDLLLHEALDLVVLDRPQLERLRLTGPRLFVLTAGMLTEKTTSHELALRLLDDERHAIFLVGYVDPDTPGGRLKASVPGQPFRFGADQPPVARACGLETFDLTAHASREELLDFVGQVSPRAVVLGHGDEPAKKWFRAEIRARYPRIGVTCPGPGEEVEL